MRSWLRGGLAALWLGLGALGEAQGTTLKAFDLEQLARRATVVVRGRVGESTAEWRGRVIHTLTRVSVTKALRGQAPSDVTVVQMGGRLGDDWMPVAGVAELSPGEEVVLFLIQQPGGEYVLAGMSQGKMHVDDNGTLAWLPTAPLWDGTAVREPVQRTFTLRQLLRALGGK